MATKTEYGKYILSAGEIGAYTVCPEAWRLRTVEKARANDNSESIEHGNRMHQEWVREFDQLIEMRRALKLIIFMAAVALFIIGAL
ncbi:MAG: hypothetical protein D6719_08505 [Candidatus Dadabacteria bacterium]|nr:MAG: hypothetical protein D6719_08505 [Candidatus Dadabacteria bacterium]